MQSDQVADFSREEKLNCITREIALRHKVYAAWVAKGKMKLEQADREIKIMLAIARDYGGHGGQPRN